MVENERYYILKFIIPLVPTRKFSRKQIRKIPNVIFLSHITPILGHCCVEYSTCTPASPVASGENDPSFAFDYFTETDKAKSGADCTEDYIEITGMVFML